MLLQAARQMLQDWAVRSELRRIDEWLLTRANLPDERMGILRALVTHQRHALTAMFACDFIRPAEVLRKHPMVCSKLETLLAELHKDDSSLAYAGTNPWLFASRYAPSNSREGYQRLEAA